MNHAAIRYLEAKRSVDDRAMATDVLETMRGSLPSDPTLLEAGCGTGTMVPRLVERGIVDGTYRGVDVDRGVVDFARDVRAKELRHVGHQVEPSPSGFAVGDLSVTFDAGDALDAFGGETGADLFVAASFADLVPLDDLLDTIESALRPGGLAYLPLSFDGATVFQPDHPADERVLRAYHRSIDERPGHDARAGRHLLQRCRDRSGEVRSVAPSDWIVRPRGDGYPADEAYFLGRILDFVQSALVERSPPVPGFEDWLETRRAQLAAGELTYVAHQYDILYRTTES